MTGARGTARKNAASNSHAVLAMSIVSGRRSDRAVDYPHLQVAFIYRQYRIKRAKVLVSAQSLPHLAWYQWYW